MNHELYVACVIIAAMFKKAQEFDVWANVSSSNSLKLHKKQWQIQDFLDGAKNYAENSTKMKEIVPGGETSTNDKINFWAI